MTLADTAAEITAETADPLEGFIFEETPVLRPGTDWHDETLYMTFPLMRWVDKQVGKGKNATTTKVKRHRTIVISSQRESFEYDEESVNAHGFSFPQSGFIQEQTTRWPIHEVQDFLHNRNPEPPEHPSVIYNDIRTIYQTHIEYGDDHFYDILPLYIMATYLYRLFPAFPYLHFNGTAATGKSQNLKLLRSLAFNCIWASNISTASLFRRADGSPGMICIDEAESFDGERGEEIRRLLNAGYKAGEPALRTETNAEGKWIVQQYDAYTPKAIASIRPLEPVIASRCIIVPMQPALVQRPEFLDTEERWGQLRNRLYRWAMHYAGDVNDHYNDWRDFLHKTHAPDITNRQWELAQPFIVLAQHVGLDVTPIIDFFSEYFTSHAAAAEESNRQHMLIRAMPSVFKHKPIHEEGSYWSIKDIHDAVTEYLEEDQRDRYFTRTTSKDLTSLGFSERQSKRGGSLVHITEEAVREQFRKRHIEPNEDDVEWLNGASYVEGRQNGDPQPTVWGAYAEELNDAE